MPMNPDSEQALEDATVKLFFKLGYDAINAYDERFGPDGTLGRESRSDVVLRPRLYAALERLNPDLPHEAISHAIEQITEDRSLMQPVRANQAVYGLLKNGVRVIYHDE